MQGDSTHSSSTGAVNSSHVPLRPAKRLSSRSNSGHQNLSPVNAHPLEYHAFPHYSLFQPPLPQPQGGRGHQHFDPYPLSSQYPVAAGVQFCSCAAHAMTCTISQPCQTYMVTGPDLLFGIPPNQYSHPRKLLYPYSHVSNPSKGDNFLPDRTFITQPQVPMETSQYQPFRNAQVTQPSIDAPIFYSPPGLSVSFAQSTQSIRAPYLN